MKRIERQGRSVVFLVRKADHDDVAGLFDRLSKAFENGVGLLYVPHDSPVQDRGPACYTPTRGVARETDGSQQ